MAKIINIGNSPKYRFTCKNCKTLAEYDVYEIKEYEDCYDDICVEYRCPVCGKHNSVLKSDLDKYRVIYDENSDKSANSIKDIIMIIFSLFLIGFIGVMLLISIFDI